MTTSGQEITKQFVLASRVAHIRHTPGGRYDFIGSVRFGGKRGVWCIMGMKKGMMGERI